MDWYAVATAVIGFLGGGGGVVALYRARSQNKVDERRQLTDEQIAFRNAMAAELSALRTQVSELSRRNDVLEDDAKKTASLTAGLKTTNEYQARQLTQQQEQITQLQRANAALEARLAELVEEKAKVVQQLQVAIAEKGFLERENAQYRQENQSLRLRLSGGAEGRADAGTE